MVTIKKTVDKRKAKILKAEKCLKMKILAQPAKLHRLRYEKERKRNKNSGQIIRRFHPAEEKPDWIYPAISVRYSYKFQFLMI